MAHMWFGDLVTMKWWDDLWLNESFAEWACYHAEVEATEFAESWTGFANARKQTGYRQDQLPSTHPIAADNYDLHAVEVNFDMITYAKGASVLKQLVAWVGLDNFLAGLRSTSRPTRSATPSSPTCSPRSRSPRAASWRAGPRSGCRPRREHARRRFELDADGTYSRFAVGRRATDWPTLRRHRLGIGLYDEVRRPPGPAHRPSRWTSRAR